MPKEKIGAKFLKPVEIHSLRFKGINSAPKFNQHQMLCHVPLVHGASAGICLCSMP